jgi:hypothetical protein
MLRRRTPNFPGWCACGVIDLPAPAGRQCWPSMLRCTVVVSIHNVSVHPARCGPNQNCWPHTPRLPLAGTIRSISTASRISDSVVGAGSSAAPVTGTDCAAIAVRGSLSGWVCCVGGKQTRFPLCCLHQMTRASSVKIAVSRCRRSISQPSS